MLDVETIEEEIEIDLEIEEEEIAFHESNPYYGVDDHMYQLSLIIFNF